MYLRAGVILAKIADGVSVTDKIILNDYFHGDKDILHEDNLNKEKLFYGTAAKRY